MKKIVLILLYLFVSTKSFAANFTCDLKSEETEIKKIARLFFNKVQSIEPKYKHIKWNTKDMFKPSCKTAERVTDGGTYCMYNCEVSNGGEGLILKISYKGELLGFESYEP